MVVLILYVRTHLEELLVPKHSFYGFTGSRMHYIGTNYISELSKYHSWHFLFSSYSPKMTLRVQNTAFSFFRDEEFFGMSSYIYQNFQKIILDIFYFHHVPKKWVFTKAGANLWPTVYSVNPQVDFWRWFWPKMTILRATLMSCTSKSIHFEKIS